MYISIYIFPFQVNLVNQVFQGVQGNQVLVCQTFRLDQMNFYH